MKKTYDKRKLLLLILSGFYLFIAFIPVITCIVTYSHVTDYLVLQETRKQTTQMSMGLEKLKASLSACENYAATNAQLPAVSSFILSPKDDKKVVSSMMAGMRALPPLNETASLVSRFYLYSHVNGATMETNGGCLDLSVHYPFRYQMGGMDYATWESDVLGGDRNRYFFPSDTEDALVFIRAIQLRSARCCFVFYYPVSGLKSLLGETGASSIALYDRDGRLLLGSDADLYSRYGVFSDYLEEEGNVITCARDQNYGLTLYMTSSRALLSNSVLRLSWDIFLNVLPFLLVCMTALILLLSISHHAIRETIKSISDVDSKGLNPFRYLQQSVAILSETSEYQRQLLEKSRDELRQAALSALLFHKDMSDEALRQMLVENDLWYEAKSYRVIQLELTDPQTGEEIIFEDKTHQMLAEITYDSREQLIYMKMDGPKRMLFLGLSDDADDTEMWRHLCTGICLSIARQSRMVPRMKIGCACPNLTQVKLSCKSLNNLFPSQNTGEEYLLFAQEKVSPQYDYTRQDDSRLIRLTRAGDIDGVNAYLQEVYERNTGANARTALETQLLYAAMLNTLLETGYNGKLERSLRYSMGEVKIDQFFCLMHQYYEQQCLNSMQNAQEEQKQLVTNLLQVIEQQFGDYRLNADMLALQFGISARSVSLLLRNEIGLGFPEYLEKVRIDHAISALRDTDARIEDIATAVGYASSDSFRRAFKRCTGKLPSVYRD